MLFHLQTSYLVPRYNPLRHIQWAKCQRQGQIFHKVGKKTNQLAISWMLFHIDFILGTKVQPIKGNSMTQVTNSITLTKVKVKGQGQNFAKIG